MKKEIQVCSFPQLAVKTTAVCPLCNVLAEVKYVYHYQWHKYIKGSVQQIREKNKYYKALAILSNMNDVSCITVSGF